MKINQIIGFVLFSCGILTMLTPFFTSFKELSTIQNSILDIIVFVSGFTSGFIGIKNIFDIKLDDTRPDPYKS